MKTYEERLAAVSEARMQAEYAETEELIEIFLDGDTMYVIDGSIDWDTLGLPADKKGDSLGIFRALKPKGANDE